MPELSASTQTITVPSQRVPNRARWIDIYTQSIALLGLAIAALAFWHLPADLPGLALFVVMAILAEAASVELFDSSHSQVSMSSVVAIASILALGPMAGVITYFATGIATVIKTRNGEKKGRASLLIRTTFNAGMLTITAFIAGQIYVYMGGVPADVQRVSNILPLIGTAAVDYYLNVLLLIGVISIQTGQRPHEIWKRDFMWQSHVAIAGGVLGGGVLAAAYNTVGIFGVFVILLPILATGYSFRLYKNNMKDYVDGLETLNSELKDAMTTVKNTNRELTTANQSILRLNAELFQSLAKVFDMRDPYVGGHAAQVATYAVAVAVEMDLSVERIEIIRQSAFLHDIGKLAIPEAILHKPGRLTEIEYEFIKKHADIGADLLASTEGLRHLAPFIRHHHERWDGRGYPLGLAGEEIPLEARILNLCDSVESMASDRPYHRGMSLEGITAEIRSCRGTQFDPQVADIFVELIQRKGSAFVINSARSVTQQYAASLLTNESLTHSMFAWVLEKKAQGE
jgi:HD-GYP domain-containing protein (c-di-GMP phosphodiesterase class II)